MLLIQDASECYCGWNVANKSMILPQKTHRKRCKTRIRSVVSTQAKHAAGESCQENQRHDKLNQMIQMQKTQTVVFPMSRLGVKQHSLV